MGALIDALNAADRIAAMWRAGEIAALVAGDELVARGFYAVEVRERAIVAWRDGVRFELDGTFAPSQRAA